MRCGKLVEKVMIDGLRRETGELGFYKPRKWVAMENSLKDVNGGKWHFPHKTIS